MSYRRHPRTLRPAPAPAGKLNRSRFARERTGTSSGAVYRVEPKPTTKLYAGPYDYVTFHRFYAAIVDTIDPRNLTARLAIHTIMREWLGSIEITSEDEEGDLVDRMRAVKQAAIDAGAVIPFDYNREPKRTTRTVELDPPPPWTHGPFRRAS